MVEVNNRNYVARLTAEAVVQRACDIEPNLSRSFLAWEFYERYNQPSLNPSYEIRVKAYGKIIVLSEPLTVDFINTDWIRRMGDELACKALLLKK